MAGFSLEAPISADLKGFWLANSFFKVGHNFFDESVGRAALVGQWASSSVTFISYFDRYPSVLEVPRSNNGLSPL